MSKAILFPFQTKKWMHVSSPVSMGHPLINSVVRRIKFKLWVSLRLTSVSVAFVLNVPSFVIYCPGKFMVFVAFNAWPACPRLALPVSFTFCPPELLFVEWLDAPVSQIQISIYCSTPNDVGMVSCDTGTSPSSSIFSAGPVSSIFPILVAGFLSPSHSATTILSFHDTYLFVRPCLCSSVISSCIFFNFARLYYVSTDELAENPGDPGCCFL